jgi:hypothetical protein
MTNLTLLKRKHGKTIKNHNFPFEHRTTERCKLNVRMLVEMMYRSICECIQYSRNLPNVEKL